jgi:hypothetical protein
MVPSKLNIEITSELHVTAVLPTGGKKIPRDTNPKFDCVEHLEV